MQDLQEKFGLAYVFISHDLAVVRHIAHRVAVMYLGRLVEMAETDTLFSAPHHPYTQALLSAAPVPDPRVERARRHVPMKGEAPSAANLPSGCRFRTRCPIAEAICTAQEPPLIQGVQGQLVACHFPGKLLPT